MKRWALALLASTLGIACGGDGGTEPGHGPGGLSVDGVIFNPYRMPADGPAGAAFTAGDELPFQIVAASDAPFTFLGYVIGGPQGFADSVAVPDSLKDLDTLFIDVSLFPTTQVTPGPIPISGIARNTKGRARQEIQNSPIHLYGATHPSTVATPTNGVILDAVVDEAGHRLFAAMSGAFELRVLDLLTTTWGTPIPLPTATTSLDLTASGDTLYISGQLIDTILRVDLSGASPSVTKVPVSISGGHTFTTGWIRVAASGRVIVSGAREDGAGQVIEYSPGTGVSKELGVIGKITNAAPLVRSGDHSRIVVVNSVDQPAGNVYISSSRTFKAEVALGGLDAPTVSMDRTGARVQLGLVTYDGGLKELLRMRPPGGSTTAINPEGSLVYYSTHEGLLRISFPKAVPLDLLALGWLPFHMLPYSDGSSLIAWDDNQVMNVALPELPDQRAALVDSSEPPFRAEIRVRRQRE